MRVQLNVAQVKGLPRRIELEAASVAEARQQALSQGYVVLSSHAAAWSWSWAAFAAPSRPSKSFAVAVFVEQLRDLLVAGLSVIEALDALRRGAKAASAVAIERLERQLREGKTLSDALSSEPVFPPLLVALVRSSELTSDLPQTLSRFLEHEQRVTELRHRLVSAAIYPLLLVGVGFFVLLFLLFYVMPRFARVFEGMTGELPWSAHVMVAWSHFLVQQSMWWLGWLLVIVAALGIGSSAPAPRERALQAVLSWGPLHDRLTTYFLARWYRATGMLVQGGIPLPQALGLSNGLLPASLRAGGQAVLQAVNDGLVPSAAHVRAGMATPVAEQLMLAGERTGELGRVLLRIAHFHETDVGRAIERTMRTLEPVLMVFIGLCVGLVVVLMYLPIFELAAAIQ